MPLQRITSDAIEGNAVGIVQLSVPTDGSPGQVLATDGNGVLMWVNQTAGSGSGSGSINVACDDPNTVLLIHSDTTNGSTIFDDSSSNNHGLIINGSLQHSTTQNKIGVSSIQFDGVASRLNINPANLSNLGFIGTGNFTVELWIWHLSTQNDANTVDRIFNAGAGGGGDELINLDYDGTNGILRAMASTVGGAGGVRDIFDGSTTNHGITDNAWHHIAYVRNGNNFNVYVDGVSRLSGSSSSAIGNATEFAFGGYSNGFDEAAGDAPSTWNGFMDELRISNVAQYTSNFTPQTTAFCQDVSDVSSTSSTFQGTDSGYTIGGHKEFSASAGSDRLDKFSFTSSSTAISVNGDLSSPRYASGSHKSITHGYVSGGSNILSPGVGTTLTQIDKWPFASESVAVATHGTLQNPRATHCGGSSETHGYVVAGHTGDNSIGTEVMEKFTTASDSDSVVISGVLSATKFHVSTSQSSTHGYVNGDGSTSNIQKYSFANDDNSIVYNGNLLSSRSYTAGQSSEINGYVSGGTTDGSTTVTNIERYSFASESNANNVGVLSVGRYGTVGTSTSTDGYSSGGLTGNGSSFSNVTVIDKFSFASNNNAIDHADLSQARHQPSSIQF